MENKEFRVSSSKGSKILTIIMVLFVEIITINLILERNNIGVIILWNVCCIPFILLLFAELLFKADVSDEKIKVRTNFGRKYEFGITDIKSVKCEKSKTTKGASHFFIDIYTKTDNLTLGDSLKGFDTIAGYLLDKLYTGEIDRKVISNSCEKILIMYKNNDYRNKVSYEDIHSQYEYDKNK